MATKEEIEFYERALIAAYQTEKMARSKNIDATTPWNTVRSTLDTAICLNEAEFAANRMLVLRQKLERE